MQELYPDAVFVAVDGASRAGTLQFGEDEDVLVEEDVPHARPLPPRTPTNSQLALPHQVAALRHGDLTPETQNLFSNFIIKKIKLKTLLFINIHSLLA